MIGRSLSCAAFVVALSHFAEPSFAQTPNNTVFVGGLVTPVDLAFSGPDRLYVVERRGTVRLVQNGVLRPQPLLDLCEEIGDFDDCAMTGIALDPAFAENGRLYLTYVVDRHHLLHFDTPSYSPTTNEFHAATIGRVTRYTCDAATGFTTIVPGSRVVLVGESLDNAPAVTAPSHASCSLQFGSDGTLLVGFGDGAWSGGVDAGSSPSSYYAQALVDGILQPAANVGAFRAQQIDSMNGKILRIDPATGDGVASNPFFVAKEPRCARSRVWSLGLRNPFRMSVRPGTGSTDPTLGRPGDLYIGDVGWTLHEEIDIATVGGQNFGWPVFEGMDPEPQYGALWIANPFAPNPLAGRGCGLPFFRFRDLLQQDNCGNLVFTNPCDTNTSIPLATPTFRHTLPALDWMHEVADTRVAVRTNGVVDFQQVGAPASGVVGVPFTGNCAIGGTWHSGLTFPPTFGPCYYVADFLGGWIKRLEFDQSGRVTSIAPFANVTLPVRLVEGPDHAIYYLTYGSSAVGRLAFGTDPPPVPIAVTDLANRQGTFDLQADGRASFDPFGDPVTLEWQLDGGAVHTEPQRGFTIVGTGNPTAHELKLTARDSAGGATSLIVPFTVDNTPPRIERIDVDNGTLFDADHATALPLAAIVADDEHPPAQITWRWCTTRHDGDDEVECSVATTPTTVATLDPIVDDGAFHAYSVSLRATDAAGDATTRRVWLFPARADASTAVVLTAPTTGDTIVLGDEMTFEAIPAGPVHRVEFRVEGELVAVATAAPWRATWRATRAGPLVACAHAIATDRTTSCSRGTEISVVAPQRCLRRIVDAGCDGHEELFSGTPAIDDPELLLGTWHEPLISAMRFEGIPAPAGAIVTSAHVDFTAAATEAHPAHFLLTYASSTAPPPIDPTPGVLTQVETGGSVSWRPLAWNLLESGAAQRTPELRDLLQPIVADPSWDGRLMLLSVGLDGVRSAVSADGDPALAPLLCFEWLPPPRIPNVHPVVGGADDASEIVATGSVITTDTALVLGGAAGGEQLTAVRFTLPIPPGAIVESARIRFHAAAAEGDLAEWTIRVEATDDATTFATTPLDVSSRVLAPGAIVWTPASWIADQSGPAQRSPELRTLLQQIVDRPGWAANHACAFVISGIGQRTAHSHDANPRLAPRLELVVR